MRRRGKIHQAVVDRLKELNRDRALAAEALDTPVAEKITQKWLAPRLHVSEGHLSKTLGEDPPDLAFLAQVADVLGMTLSELSERAGVPIGWRYDIYLSTPFQALTDDSERSAQRADAAALVAAMRSIDLKVYWPLESVPERSAEWESGIEHIAAADNIRAILSSEALVYFQSHALNGSTSALVELGYAMGKQIRTTVMVAGGVQMPFMLRRLDALAAQLSDTHDALTKPARMDFATVDEACEAVRTRPRMFGLRRLEPE